MDDYASVTIQKKRKIKEIFFQINIKSTESLDISSIVMSWPFWMGKKKQENIQATFNKNLVLNAVWLEMPYEKIRF